MTGIPNNRGDELRIPIYNAMRDLVAQQGVKQMHFITVYVLGPEEEGEPETSHLVSSLPTEFVVPLLLQMVTGMAAQPDALTKIDVPDSEKN